MKTPYPRPEVKVRIGAMSETMPSYTIEEAAAEAERLRAETAEAIAGNLNPKAIWDRFNKRL